MQPYRCDQCPMSFNVEYNLGLHKSTHTTSDPKCQVCNKKFSRVASLKAHVMIHEKEENFLCSECGDEFILQSQLSVHLEEHRQELSGTKSHTCKTCSKEFSTQNQLKEHLKSHSKIRPVITSSRNYKNIDRRGFRNICHHCGKTFKKPSQLVRHIRIHTGERPYKCTHCGKAFNQKVVLQTHMVRHTGEKPHMCLLCPASFSQKGNLHSHVQRVHSQATDVPLFPCMDCSCVYKKLGSLNAHISKMHISVMEVEEPATQKGNARVDQGAVGSEGAEGVTDVIQQLLELSDNVTADGAQAPPPGQAIGTAINQDILQQALENSGLTEIPVQPETQSSSEKLQPDTAAPTATSTNDGPVPSKILITDTVVKKEKRSIIKKPPQMLGTIRQENGVRWHGCPYCSKEFKKPSDLVRHIRIHTHEKPYKCKQCFRAFAVKSTLTAHMKIHTGIKAFECQYCMKRFSTSGSMKVHQRLHTGLRPFPCPHCEKFFRTSGHRKTHVTSHFKSIHHKKHKYPRKTHKTRMSRSNLPLPDIPLQEPILITEMGLLQNQNSRAALQQYLDIVENERPYKCGFCSKAYKKSSHLKQHIRYELAQQLQQQQSSNDMQPSTAVVGTGTQSMLEVVGDGQQVTLPTALGEDALQETESFVSAQHAHMGQFEAPALPQPTFEQPAMTQVQQLQDSSTLESQALTASYHPPNLLHVTHSETSGLLQEASQGELQLSIQTQDFQDEDEINKRVYQCSMCDKSFKKSSHLKQHVRSHTGEKPYC
ncbi:hypothetical protein cypCar_00023095 [Cyprinus carpio]|nr:hypothetical protein cypCar_00023095 [Cyprinus carpio]